MIGQRPQEQIPLLDINIRFFKCIKILRIIIKYQCKISKQWLQWEPVENIISEILLWPSHDRWKQTYAS